MPSTRQLADECLKTATTQLKISTDYKLKRFHRIDEALGMMLGKIKPRIRQTFNIPLPVLSGLLETLCADLDDPVQIKVKSASKNLKAVKGINETFNIYKKSLKLNHRWDYKDRISRKYAVTYGRGILKYFSSAEPYKNTLEAVNPQYFHCQPQGGGLLEKHLFCGEEGIFKTKKQIEQGVENGIYDKKGAELLFERAENKDYQDKMSAFQDEKNARFKALGLDPDANNFVGEITFNLCEWVLTKFGQRWYLLFDPWNRIWLRFEPLAEMFSAGYFPFLSYATHEDDQNFWSMSILADILYPIADGIITLFNQNLTNRQKRNLNAKLYDKDMIKNVGKLDEAQYRPDSLVAVDTFGGTRRLDQGIYVFQTPELTGTIDLIQWLDEFTAKSVGIYQNLPALSKGAKTNNIVYAEIQQLAKRIDYRSHGYTECWGELALRHIQGIKDNMNDSDAEKILGPETGFEFKKNLKEIKLDKEDIEIISTKAQAQEDALRKSQKEKSLELLAQDSGINLDWKRRHILSDIGGWEQDEVEDALDLRGQGVEKDQLASADEAIRDLLKNKEPETCFNATTIFQRKILDFAVNHRLSLKELYPKFLNYIRAHNQIVTENMAQLALRQRAANQAGQTPPPAPAKKPAVKIAQRRPQPMMQRGQPTPVMVNQA